MQLKRILYISDRLNAPDGSSVHGRQFVNSVKQAGVEIQTYPAIQPILIPQAQAKIKKNIRYYFSRFMKAGTIAKAYLHRSSGYAAEWLDAWAGLQAGSRDFGYLQNIVQHFQPEAIVYRTRLFNQAPFKVGKQNGIPVLCEINTLKTIENRINGHTRVTSLTKNAERRMIHEADAIFTVSNAIARQIERYCPQGPVHVIPNGVDVDVFNPDCYDKNKAKSRLGLNGKKVIGYVGSYKKWHGLDTTMETLSLLQKIDPSYHLILVGHGECSLQVNAMVSRLRLDHAVTQTGPVPHDAIGDIMAAFDVALMSYPVIDPFYFSPLKMFEYMAMGVCVVATAVGQIAEVISSGENGLLVSSPEPGQFAIAVQEAMEQAASLGPAGRRHVMNHYSWQANARQVLETCRQMIKNHHTGKGRCPEKF
jgi:glycosyltransferase involved in cell wall biosynthesis